MKKYFTKEITIGVITIFSLLILYIGVNYLKGMNVFKPSNHYYVKMNNVNELQKSNPVYVNGFNVGLVSLIEYNFHNPDNIIVQVSLDKNMRVEKGSHFELKSSLTAGAYLNLILSDPVGSYYEIGDTIPGISDPGMMDKVANDLLPQFEKLLPRLDSILAGIEALVNHPALSQSLDNVASTTSRLDASSRQLNTLLSRDIPAILGNIHQVSEDFTLISGQLKQLDFNNTLQTVEKTLENIDQMAMKINSKDSSLGLLMNDRSLYDNLNSTAKNASDLLLDFQQNPKRYVHFSVF